MQLINELSRKIADKIVQAILKKENLVVSGEEANELLNWFDNGSNQLLPEYFQRIKTDVEKISGNALEVASTQEIQQDFAFRVKGTTAYLIFGLDCYVVIGPYITAVEMAN
ncbi:MAG: hypothetical protein WC678_05605 [Parcubacteria group bacterium]|jgi:hypothetical protein